MSSFVLSSGALARADAPGFLRGGALRSRTGAPAARGRAGPVQTNAFFGGFGGAPKSNGAAMVCIDCGEDVHRTQAFFGGFGGGGVPKANGQPMLCIDCGYIYRGDFDALPKDYKCPQCNVGKNRFKVVEQAGSAYSNLAAQKKANKAAAAKAKKGKGPSPRELARQRMIEAQEEADAKKGRGFFGR
jgi:rubredoxin